MISVSKRIGGVQKLLLKAVGLGPFCVLVGLGSFCLVGGLVSPSGGSRGGSMGSMEPLFLLRAAFENISMRKRTKYTTLTLELRTLASQ